MSNPPPDPSTAFAAELATAGRKMRKLFDGMARARGLTLARARALLLLRQDRHWNQTELAEVLEIEHPSLVRLLDGLERQGLVRRLAVEGDRRARRIALTPLARGQVLEVEALTASMRATLLRGIDPAALETACAVLRQVARNAEAAEATPDPAPASGPGPDPAPSPVADGVSDAAPDGTAAPDARDR